MLADIQRTVYPEEVTYELHFMAQVSESLPVIEQTFLNTQKSLGGHAKNPLASPLLKSIKIYSPFKRR